MPDGLTLNKITADVGSQNAFAYAGTATMFVKREIQQ